MRGRGRLVLALAGAALLAGGIAWGHSAGLSRGEYRFEDGTLFATITFARGEVSDLVPRLDANLDGGVSEAEVSASKPAMQQAIVNGAKVTAAGSSCRGMLDDAKLVEGDGLEILARWDCPPAPAAQVELDFLDSLTRGHRHLLTLVGATSGAASFAYREERSFSVPAVHTRPRVGWAERWRLAQLGALSSLAPVLALLLLLGFGGAARDLRRTALAFLVAVPAACAIAAHAGFSVRLAAPGAALAFLFVGVEGFAGGSARGRWAGSLAAGAALGVWLAQRIGDVPMPVREKPAATLPFAIGGAFALLVASVLAISIVAPASRRPFWMRNVVPALASLALGIGAWWLVRAT